MSDATHTEIPYQQHLVHVGGGGQKPKSVILTGHFFGANKNTDYQSLNRHFTQEDFKLKRLYWDTDKFHLGFGVDCKKTHTGGRTNFIDFVASFKPIFSMLFGATEKTGGTNDGNIDTYVHYIEGVVPAGVDSVVLTDSEGTTITINFTASGGNRFFEYNFVSMQSSGGGIFTSKFNYTEIGGVQATSVTKTGRGLLRVAAGSGTGTITTEMFDGAVSQGALTTETIKLRDGWSA